MVGLMVYPFDKSNGLFNIGDYIQSLAVRQFIKDKIIFINRERLDEYEGDKIKMVLNGWFMHEPQHWPPSNDIIPCFLAFHLNSTVYDSLLSNQGIEYLKKFSPIGCRDKATLRILQKKGIDAYFSGCMTLTLGSFKHYGHTDCKKEKIYFVDPYANVIRDPLFLFRNAYKIVKSFKSIWAIQHRILKKKGLTNFFRSYSFYLLYSNVFEDEIFKTAESLTCLLPECEFSTEEEKFKYAEDRLNLYADAKLIITSRIHCALPCLALETPVIYVDKYNAEFYDSCRLDGLLDLFNVIALEHNQLKFKFFFSGKKIGLHSVLMNKSDYKKYRKSLIDKCSSFFSRK